MIRRTLLAIAASVLTLGWVGAAPSAQATDYSACDGVWVIVDFGSLPGGVQVECATEFSTGTVALRTAGKAGFDPTLSDGFVERIAGKPTKSDPTKAYWSYWHASRKSDGSYGSWSYSNDGSNAYHPKKGDAEGWHYVSLSEKASGPGKTPAVNPAVAPTPTPTPTKSSPKPTKKATTASPTSASATAKASATVSSQATAATSASPSAAASSPTPSTSVAPATDVTVVAAEAPTADTTQPASGSPVGTIAAGVAVIAAAGGIGGWWLVKGRRR